MDDYMLKHILSSAIFIAIEMALLFVVAIILSKISGYVIKDIFFIEGIVSVIIGVLSSMAGNSKGLSIQSMGRNNASITGNNNLRITEMENKNFKDYFKSALSFKTNAVSLIICGIIWLILSFII